MWQYPLLPVRCPILGSVSVCSTPALLIFISIFQHCLSGHWKAINNSRGICMHLMLCSVVKSAISPAASVPLWCHHGQLLLFSIQKDSSWFQHHGQLPTLYYSGSWSELILAWKSGVSLLTNPCPLHRTHIISELFQALYPPFKRPKKRLHPR